MNPVIRRIVPVVLMLLLAACGSSRSEPDVLAALSSLDANVVYEGLAELEERYPGSKPGLAKAEALTADSRPLVRRKAVRVLGALHAPVKDATVDATIAMLGSADTAEVVDALKALRGMAAKRAVPRIMALVTHATDPHVLRDCCRTLAVLGDAAVVAAIEPLLQHPDEEVRKDAAAAIATLHARAQ